MTREEAAQAIRHDISLHHDYLSGEYRKALRMAVDSLEQSARKTGKWISGKCDQCGGSAPFWSMASTYCESDYCPNCGADMRGEQDGKTT